MLSLHQAKVIALDPTVKEEFETRKSIEILIDHSLINLFETGETEMVLPLPKRLVSRMRLGTLEVIITLYTALGWTLKVLEDSGDLVLWLLIRRPAEAFKPQLKYIQP